MHFAVAKNSTNLNHNAPYTASADEGGEVFRIGRSSRPPTKVGGELPTNGSGQRLCVKNTREM